MLMDKKRETLSCFRASNLLSLVPGLLPPTPDLTLRAQPRALTYLRDECAGIPTDVPNPSYSKLGKGSCLGLLGTRPTLPTVIVIVT